MVSFKGKLNKMADGEQQADLTPLLEGLSKMVGEVETQPSELNYAPAANRENVFPDPRSLQDATSHRPMGTPEKPVLQTIKIRGIDPPRSRTTTPTKPTAHHGAAPPVPITPVIVVQQPPTPPPIEEVAVEAPPDHMAAISAQLATFMSTMNKMGTRMEEMEKKWQSLGNRTMVPGPSSSVENRRFSGDRFESRKRHRTHDFSDSDSDEGNSISSYSSSKRSRQDGGHTRDGGDASSRASASHVTHTDTSQVGPANGYLTG